MIRPSADKKWDCVVVLDSGTDSSFSDRYTVIINDKEVYAMSSNPLDPQGCNLFACQFEDLAPRFVDRQVRVDNDDLPEEVKVAIQRRLGK